MPSTCVKVAVFLPVLVAVLVPLLMFLARDYGPVRGFLPFLTPRDTYQYHVDDIPDLSGKVALITGANIGLGFQTAKHIAAKGADTYLLCRSASKCDAAVAEVKAFAPGAKATAVICDLSNLKTVAETVTQFAKDHDQLDILVLNAGVMACPFTLTADGLELQYGVNHVAHHLLATRILPLLQKAPSATVTVVSSAAMYSTYPDGMRPVELLNSEAGFDTGHAYGQSKLMNIWFAQEFAARLADQPIYVNAIHPGAVLTGLSKHLKDGMPAMLASLFESAEKALIWDSETSVLTQLYTATSPDVVKHDIRGKYFVPIAREHPTAALGGDLEKQQFLWKHTEQLLAKLGV